ncbi:UDP-glucose 4-epimerase family protein [Pseudoalteromonas ardens]|uniref:UDP-glucose 4-epimerase n=1 Tax=Pseudoalteromonas rubra TaxID=43658 RepID=A0A0L0ET74_9GAMM|nr:SDR family oxidoreductase [Pseudoalteromonas sp. R96]KNC67565.1 UDP-glucose 4-epimerase [Pseudoalteromonas rubra]MDK1312584.1 SDR family oxidoreductase [Pseudoalteromonas sp. R96]
MTKLLLTGYSGFVGTHLVKQLSPSDDVKMLGRSPAPACSHWQEALLNDSTDYTPSVMDVDVVIHIAARVHVMNESAADPLSEFRATNVAGTINLAKQAAEAGVKRFIFISSVKVNGESTTSRQPFTADDSPQPEDPYGISKAEAETQLIQLGNETGMEIVIIRPPLVYGEGVKANFSALMRFVNKGVPLPFQALKHNRRSLVSVYNLVDLIKVCITHPAAAGQVFLVSDDHDLSTADMVAMMANVQGKKNIGLPVPAWGFRIVGKLLRKEDMVERLIGSLQVDISHTKTTLNWCPPYSVEHGFRLSVKK